VSTINCCRKNCVQPFSCAKIHALRFQFFHEGGQYFKSHRLLYVHRQIHLDAYGNEMITLEGVDVCSVAWYTIMGVSRATYYRWKVNANNGLRAEHHGNIGTVKPRSHILLDLLQSYCGTWKVLRCILLGSYLLEVARLSCFKHCSLGLICARVPFLLQQQIPLWRLFFLQF
jgi:hypothetical protein